MIYVFNILTILFYYICTKHIKKINKKEVFLILCLIQMTLIVGLRYKVGADFESYRKIFELIGKGAYDVTQVEVCYKFLCRIVYILGGSYYTLNMIVAFLTFLFVTLAIKKISADYFCSIYLYITLFFFYHAMNQTRQQLAIAIGLYAMTFLCEDKIKEFIVLVVLASLFHTSIILFLCLVILKKVRITKKTMYIYIMAVVILLLSFEFLMRILKYTRYGFYLSSYNNSNIMDSTIINTFVRIAFLMLVWSREKYVQDTSKKNVLYHMAFLCTIFQIITIRVSLFGRITTNFFIVYILLIPEIIKTYRVRYRKLIWQGCLIMSALYNYIYYYYFKVAVLVNDYHSILGEIGK